VTDRKPNATIQWLDKTILVYLDDSLADRTFDIAKAISEESDRAKTKEDLRRGVVRVALANELELVTFAADGGAGDPLEMLVTIGLRPQPKPSEPTILGPLNLTRDEFAARFQTALERVTEQVSEQLNRPIVRPSQFDVLLLEVKGQRLDFERAVDALYRGADESYVFIDVALRIDDPDAGLGWVRPSGHHPRAYADVWDAEGIGPFKAIGGIGTNAEWETAKTQGKLGT